jgi:sec-independent protein translocase protein TatA
VGQIGPFELILVAIIALIVLGPKRLPEAARAVGKGIREMREAMSGESHDDDEPEPIARRTEPEAPGQKETERTDS